VIIGFIGTGAITESVVRGLHSKGSPFERILVSPRNAQRASTLASGFSDVTIAADNQAVIDESDIVCIAVRPQIAEKVLAPLEFPSHKTVLSFVATLSFESLRPWVAPAACLFRMVPIPAVERGEGPVILFPPDEDLQELFAGLGTIVPVTSESDLHSLWAVTAFMAPYFGLLHAVSAWLRRRGLEPADADIFTSAFFDALSTTARAVHGEGFDELAREHATLGGLNEQLRRELAANDWFGLTAHGLDLILDRLEGRATLEDILRSERP
tara:strand:- start:28935 stop:29741 length:807 start_codon:yes stop_codon:yes gene_type:complete